MKEVFRIATTSLSLAVSFPLLVSNMGMAQSDRVKEENAQRVNEDAMEWLHEIQTNTVQIADRAATLKIMTRHPGSHNRATHEAELLRVRNSINQIGDLVPRLQNETDTPKWQEDIIDEVSSLLAAMGSQTEKALTFVREAPSDVQLNTDAYEARLVSIDHYAKHINEVLEYADARAEWRRQQEQTHLLTSPTTE